MNVEFRKVKQLEPTTADVLGARIEFMSLVEETLLEGKLVRVVTKAPRFSRSTPILRRLHWLPVKFLICTKYFRAMKDNQPAYLADLLVRQKCSKYLHTTNSNIFVSPRIKTKTGTRVLSLSGPASWNALSVPIRNGETILTFRKLLKSHLFDLALPP